MYRAFGYAHATMSSTLRRLREVHGQGTVEYVALILLVAAIMGGIVAATTNHSEGTAIAKKVTDELKKAIDGVVAKAPGR